jgi:hypothetical protein
MTDTVLRVAVARARLSLSVSPEMLVHWLYTMRGIEESFPLYSQVVFRAQMLFCFAELCKVCGETVAHLRRL